MNFDRMREIILDKAVRGELVSQLTEDGVVAQIGNTPKEELFPIPKSWKWTTLNDIGKWKAGGTPSRSNSEYYGGEIPWLKTGDLNDGLITSVEEYISRAGVDNSSAHINPEGAVLIAMYGATIGKLGVLAMPCATNQACCACVVNEGLVDKWYLFYYLLSQRSGFIQLGAGGAQPNISRTKIVSYPIPVPPLKEQARIVDKISDALTEIDRAEKAYEELQTLAGVLKGQILQKAIRGKLVPQLADERKVDQIGVAPEEVPFEIPESWKWVQLKSIGQIIGGGTPKTSVADYWNGDISWITPADLGKNTSKWILKGAKSITQKGLDESSAKLMPEGSVVYSSRAPIGHIAIAAHELCTNQGCKSFVPDAQFITTEWAYYMLIARTMDIQSRASGTTFKEISGKGVGETWVSLPSIAEQQRIVSKVEELFKQVDALSAQ